MADEPMKGTDRKYKVALLSLALCTICFVGTAFFEKLGDNYSTFVMAVGMVLGLYGGANVGNKWVLAKHGALFPPPGEPEETLVKEKKEDKGQP